MSLTLSRFLCSVTSKVFAHPIIGAMRSCFPFSHFHYSRINVMAGSELNDLEYASKKNKIIPTACLYAKQNETGDVNSWPIDPKACMMFSCTSLFNIGQCVHKLNTNIWLGYSFYFKIFFAVRQLQEPADIGFSVFIVLVAFRVLLQVHPVAWSRGCSL